MTEQQKQELEEKREQAVTKRARHSYRHRGTKNFFIWFLGVLFGIILIAGIGVAGVFLVPVKTYLDVAGVKNQNDYVSERVAKEPMIKSIMNIGTYEVADIAFVANMLDDLIAQSGMDQIMRVDVAKLKTVKLSKLGEGLKSCIKISKQLFGDDFSQLEIFKTVEVPAKDMPSNPLAAGEKAKLYYYLASGEYGQPSAVYERAYKDDGTLVAAAEGKTLYYIDLTELVVEDIIDVIGPRFKLMSIKSVLETFGGATDTSMVVKILGDRNIGDIGSIKAEDIKLCDVVEITDVRVKNIMSDVTNGKEFEEITVADLANLNTDNIKMKNVLGTGINDDLKAMLVQATGKAYDVMTLQDVKEIDNDDIKEIKLCSVIQLESTDGLYKILTGVLGDYDEITIGDLTGVDISEVLLKDVFDLTEDMKKIVIDMLVDGDEITSYDQIKLSAFENIDAEQIAKIKLASVLNPTSAPKLYSILEDVTGISRHNITVEDLGSFQVGNLNLSTILVIEDNEILFDILVDALGGEKAAADITIGDLSGTGFSINNIKLATVVSGTTGNKIIDKLALDDTVTIGNIGEKANALKLADIIDVNVMIAQGVTSEVYTDDAIYTLNADGVTYELVDGTFDAGSKKYHYTGLNTSKTYYRINPEAGVWFIALTELTDGTYSATQSGWGAYATIKVTEGCALGELVDMNVDISNIKMKALKDLGLLSATINGVVYNYNLADLLA